MSIIIKKKGLTSSKTTDYISEHEYLYNDSKISIKKFHPFKQTKSSFSLDIDYNKLPYFFQKQFLRKDLTSVREDYSGFVKNNPKKQKIIHEKMDAPRRIGNKYI